MSEYGKMGNGAKLPPIIQCRRPKTKSMRCVVCDRKGPVIGSRDWKGWSQCGVVEVRFRQYRCAEWCPKHESMISTGKSFSLRDLKSKWRKEWKHTRSRAALSSSQPGQEK